MNLNDGGKQPKLRSTVWQGVTQHLVYPPGSPLTSVVFIMPHILTL